MATPNRNQFRLPDFQAISKLPLLLNPLYNLMRVESTMWLERLAAYAYPTAAHPELRTICDLTNCIFVFDEITDEQTFDEAQHTAASYLGGLAGEACDGSVISQMTCDIGERLRARFGPNAFRRFLEHSEQYVNEVVREAGLRERGEVLGLEEYKRFRRATSSSRTQWDLYEYCFGFELPDEIVRDPVFVRMCDTAVDVVSWTNDAHSYDMEQAKGLSAANILTVIMNAKQLPLQAAADYLAAEYTASMAHFMTDKAELVGRSYGKANNANLLLYISGLEAWISGVIEWDFLSKRYFGERNEEVAETLIVPLTIPQLKAHL
ncbi:Linoleate 10R-lipoxygenase COP4 [Sparassis crispa]|uniref:Terpene synthase n=1 Tax=Sparassis crispa TaxID=139825 RepID=A0A401GIA4_9APHY|nr:Linoleate 10R-lipoxygenase COP4 [Sparassis crispa]GBE81930.1 Linoleate 10R-lipoxygenase COP4 [Sparassis crispa]